METLETDILKCCLACLKKSSSMIPLNENIDQKNMLLSFFHIELTKYTKCPQFLCSVCSSKLDIIQDFSQQISRSLLFLEAYSIKIELMEQQIENNACNEFEADKDKELLVKENTNNLKNMNADNDIEATEDLFVSLDEVNTAIDNFKKRFCGCKECIICGYSAINRRALCIHMALIHKDKKKTWCRECNKTFEDIDKHKRIHHGLKFSCPFCRRMFNRSHFVEHVRSHSGTFQCTLCSKTFKSSSWLKNHIKIHTNDRAFKCSNCPKSFACEKRFKTEKDASQHECDSKEVVLGACEVTIKTDQDGHNTEETIIIQHATSPDNAFNLQIHTRSHTGQLPYKCSYCDRKVSTRSRLVDHERTHTKEKPFICNVCGKGFAQTSALNTHMKQHTGRPEVCDLCGRRFCRKSELKLHMSKHIGIKPFLCTECGQAFAQKSHLTEHMIGHGQERPYKCQFCEKAFKKNVLLKGHLKIHRGEKAFKCTSCSYACYTAYRLQQHMKLHLKHAEIEPGRSEVS